LFSFAAVKPGDEKLLATVSPLFEKMYAEMSGMGLTVGLVEDGAGKWIKGIEKTLGRMSYLVAAKENNNTLGFAHGSLRFMPDYLGGFLTGNITHIYVLENHRGEGIAGALLKELENWFLEKKVASIDLEVVPSNEEAKRFWLSKGYVTEFTRYRKVIP
jgi:ribosomal protein S18 acetylase RimI-like enzyme